MKKLIWAIIFMVLMVFPPRTMAENTSQHLGGIDSMVDDVSNDYSHFYSGNNLRDLGIGIGVSGLVANSSSDGEIQDWVQDSLRNQDTDKGSETVKLLGEGAITIPLYGAAALVGEIAASSSWGSATGAWGRRSLRAILVGAPPVLLLQRTTGASRPKEDNSYWRPFNDNNGVSGHSFMGAVPFIVAANMTENHYIRYSLYLGSMLCGWSRMNDNSHYFSQAALGWWIAYLSASCGNHIEKRERQVLIRPGPIAGGIGIVGVVTF